MNRPTDQLENFIVIINPFTNRLKIKHKDVTQELEYNTFDEWIGFESDGKEYDIHVFYEEKLSLSIYDVEDNNTVTSYWHNVETKIVLTDNEFENS